MKSKIKIDLDGSDNPVLRIELSKDCEDLRDKALRKLIDRIGFNSNSLFIRRSPIPISDSDPTTHYEIYPFSQLEHTINWKEHGPMMMRFEAEQLLARSLEFDYHDHSNGVTIWRDAEGFLYRWEKYGFGRLERKVKGFPTGKTASDSIAGSEEFKDSQD